MSKKEIIGYINLTIDAGKATPSPPVGPALAQKKLNIMEFCKAFNARTKDLEPGTPIPVVITAFVDKTFEFVCKSPPVSYFLKKYASIEKGSQATRRNKSVGTITLSQCEEIAKIKIQDLNTDDIKSAVETIKGTAFSMGLEVLNEN